MPRFSIFRKTQVIPTSAEEESVFAALAPFRVEPWYSPRPWGFRDLRPWYDLVPEGEPIGEAWLTGDDCRVATGSHAGKTLGKPFS